MSLHLNPGDAKAFTRREFLRNGTLFASAALTVPAFLQSSAFALPRPMAGLSSIAGVDEGRILVVVQLSGGNDGLNTVVPFRDDVYRRVRPTIGLGVNEVHHLSKNGAKGAHDVGLHPAMTQLRELYDEGLCSVVQSVGYPNPNRSHFASMDIWHTADTQRHRRRLAWTLHRLAVLRLRQGRVRHRRAGVPPQDRTAHRARQSHAARAAGPQHDARLVRIPRTIPLDGRPQR
jgi:uncharacterized protein (DUF1501 family)